jgi:hypothetical protein
MHDVAAWQALLDHNDRLFDELEPGASALLLGKAEWDAGVGHALLWRKGEQRMEASLVPWTGITGSAADFIFVALRDAFARLDDADTGVRLGLLREQVREGDMLFFITKNCADLDVGWDAFLESLGHAFMGACR